MNDLAVLLAAGAGRRFWPFHEARNKCAFPIANQPLVLRLARQIRALGISRIAVVVGADEGSIRAALRPLGEEDIVFVRQPLAASPGTAAGARLGLEAVGGMTPEHRALILHGDVFLADSDLRAFWQQFTESDAEAAALCAPLNGERPQDWIGVSLKARPTANVFTLNDIEGHGRDAADRFAGIWALGPNAWPALRATPDRMTRVPVGGMPAEGAELAETLAMLLDEGADVWGMETAQPCVDVDKPWHILEATEAALREMAASLHESGSIIDSTADVSPDAEITGPVYVGPGAVIGKRVVLKGCAWIEAGARVINGAIVGENVRIGARSRVSDYCLVGENSVIGSDCVVGHGGEFSGVMLDRSYIYHYSEIYGVVGAAVDIGAATVCGTLRFDDAETIHRVAGRREIPRVGSNATYFGDHSRTGVSVITQPGVKIGAFSCVGPGIVVYQDVPSRKLLLLKQEIVERDWGPERYGW